MDFINIAKSRSSVRDYNNKKVEPEKLEKILEPHEQPPESAPASQALPSFPCNRVPTYAALQS